MLQSAESANPTSYYARGSHVCRVNRAFTFLAFDIRITYFLKILTFLFTKICIYQKKCVPLHRKVRIGAPDGRKRSASGGESGGIGFTSKAPANFNLWEEEEARQLYLLHSNLIVDRRFRRSGAV